MKLFKKIRSFFENGESTKKETEIEVFNGKYRKTKTSVSKDVEIANINSAVELEKLKLENNKIDLLRQCINLDAKKLMVLGSILTQITQTSSQSEPEPVFQLRGSSTRASTRASTRVESRQTSPLKIIEGQF